jgi:transcriptional regulator with XRE-family HTH domain
MTTSPASFGDRVDRRDDLREFLMARRARVTPEEAGLPAGARRRTPGLRREEVAVLAGVGVSWYQWLEQGRDITVSPQVLDAVARVLRLNEAERRHLYVLAGLNPPLPEDGQDGSVAADLLRVIEAWMPKPAHIADRYWNLIAANDAAKLVLGFTDDEDQNCLVSFFTDPMYRTRYADWQHVARTVVANYRGEMTEHPGDVGYALVVDGLLEISDEFAELWSRHEAEPSGTLIKHLEHPLAGTLVYESVGLRLPQRPDLKLQLHNPCAGTDTAVKVERLLADRARVAPAAARPSLRLVRD